MYQENVVLCGASAYEQKYYFNQDFASLPETIKQELQVMCVLYTEDVGGILTLEFDENGNLQFKTEATDSDFRYDEIGSVLKMYYRVFFLGEDMEESVEHVDNEE